MAYSTSTNNNFVLDQAADQAEFIFQTSEAATITRIGIRVGVITGAPPVYAISLQGVDGSGNPDGAIKGGGSPASGTFTPSALGWLWITLANPYTCTRGEYLSIVVTYSSGTINSSNDMSVSMTDTIDGGRNTFPYSIQNNNGVRTRSLLRAIFGYSSASKVYGCPVDNVSVNTIASDTTPDEAGMRWRLLANVLSSYSVVGFRVSWRSPVAAKLLVVNLYDTDGTTVLQTLTYDSDFASAIANDASSDHYFQTATLATLRGGSFYRLGFVPQETGNNLRFRCLVVTNAADLDAFACGQDWTLCTRTDAGAWTDDLLSRPLIELILQDAVGPGVLLNSGMVGGMRG